MSQSLTVREVQTTPCRAHGIGSVGLRACSDFWRENQVVGSERYSLERCVLKNSRMRGGPKRVI